MKKIFNSKGEAFVESSFLFWRVFLIVSIALITVLSLNSVFSSKQDVRPVEAAFISQTFSDCLAQDGKISKALDFEKCLSLDEKEFFLHAELKLLNGSPVSNKTFGDPNIQVECTVSENTEFSNAPFCEEYESYVLIEEKSKVEVERGTLNLFIGIRKISENVN